MKTYRWNWRKCIGNLSAVLAFVAIGLLIGYVFAMWAMEGGLA